MSDKNILEDALTELERDQLDSGWVHFVCTSESFPNVSDYVNNSRGYPNGATVRGLPIEDDLIVGNADHMLWVAKELASCKDDPARAQYPFVMGKLDTNSIQEFDFSKYQGYIKGDDGVGGGGGQKNQDEGEDVNKKNFGQFFKKVNARTPNLNLPSMLILMANSIEIIRLRSVLIQALE